MTIIAFDGKTLAADSLMTVGKGLTTMGGQKIMPMHKTFCKKGEKFVRVKWVAICGNAIQASTMIADIEKNGNLESYFYDLPRIADAYTANYIFLLEDGEAVYAKAIRAKSKFVLEYADESTKMGMQTCPCGCGRVSFGGIIDGSGLEWVENLGTILPVETLTAQEIIRLGINSPTDNGCGGHVISVTADSDSIKIEPAEHSDEFIREFMNRSFAMLVHNRLPENVLELANNVIKIDTDGLAKISTDISGDSSPWSNKSREDTIKRLEEEFETKKKLEIATNPVAKRDIEVLLGENKSPEFYMFATPQLYIYNKFKELGLEGFVKAFPIQKDTPLDKWVASLLRAMLHVITDGANPGVTDKVESAKLALKELKWFKGLIPEIIEFVEEKVKDDKTKSEINRTKDLMERIVKIRTSIFKSSVEQITKAKEEAKKEEEKEKEPKLKKIPDVKASRPCTAGETLAIAAPMGKHLARKVPCSEQCTVNTNNSYVSCL